MAKVKVTKSFGHVRLFIAGLGGMGLPNIDVETDIRSGEGVFEAIGRAMFEQQQQGGADPVSPPAAMTPAPAPRRRPRKRVKSIPVKSIEKRKEGDRG
jgi:hypothetical protein